MNPEIFVGWIRQQTSWLYLQVYQNHLFFIDFWSIVHCWSGFVVFTLLLVRRYRQPWLWLTLYLFFYELAEISMVYWSMHLFKVETIKDQFTDLFVGLLGGSISYLFLYQKSRFNFPFLQILDFESLLVAMTFAFLWVGQARFFFPQPVTANLYGLGLFFWRLLAVYCMLRIYVFLKRVNDNKEHLVLFSGTCIAFFFLTGVLAGKGISFTMDMDLSRQTINAIIYLGMFPMLAILCHQMVSVMLHRACIEFALRSTRQTFQLKRRILEQAREN